MFLSNKVLFEEGKYGLRAVLQSKWSEELKDLLLRKNIAELVINDAKGWSGENIDFVLNFRDLKSLDILDFRLKSITPVQYLINLRRLNISTYCNTILDYTLFPYLETLWLEWRKGSESIFKCRQLKDLFINCYRGKDTALFSQLHNLESLSIYNASIKTLVGLRELKQLKCLRLANFRTLTSLDGIEDLVLLEKLEIDGCRKITSIDQVSSLLSLRKLSFSNGGNIQSLTPIQGLNNLEELYLFASTNILDGEVGFLKNMPKLSRIAFMNRKHYSDKCDEIEAVLSAKNRLPLKF